LENLQPDTQYGTVPSVLLITISVVS